MPHAKKELNPLWGLLNEPLFQIIAAVGLLLNGVLSLVGRLVSFYPICPFGTHLGTLRRHVLTLASSSTCAAERARLGRSRGWPPRHSGSQPSAGGPGSRLCDRGSWWREEEEIDPRQNRLGEGSKHTGQLRTRPASFSDLIVFIAVMLMA
ncbi:hypothetical protein VTK73DRAFT_9388 [Phialemonium thermophilum]|uniref:DUF6987 domain-containing protein n=1 Tax=Phialemonium thermophilum TaxID=223376 RepID=A0ABR3W2T3_9PEZI